MATQPSSVSVDPRRSITIEPGYSLLIDREGPVCVSDGRGPYIEGDMPGGDSLLMESLRHYSRHLRHMGKPGPVKAKFLATGLCNLRCYYCSASSSWSLPGLTTEEVELALTRLREAGVFLLQWHGGESTIRADFLRLLQFADRLGFYVEFFTNGSSRFWSRPETSQALRDLDAQPSVTVSLLAGNAEKHDRLAGRKGAFQKALETVETLIQAGCPVQLGVALTTETVDELGAVADIARSLGVRLGINTQLYSPGFGGIDVLKYEVSPDEIRRARRDVLGEEEVLLRNRTCVNGTLSLTVGHNGDIVGCERNLAARFGNLLEQSLSEILSGAGLHQYMDRVYKQPKSCVECPEDLKSFCSWCPAEPLNLGIEPAKWQEYHCAVASRRRLFWTAEARGV